MSIARGIAYFTIDRLRAFHINMLDVHAWYARHLCRDLGMPCEEVLTSRIVYWPWLKRSKDPAWRVWLDEHREVIETRLLAPDPDAWASWFRETSLPFLDAGMEEEYCRQWIEPLRPPYHGFSFEYHAKYNSDDPQHVLTLHFRNAFMPESPFDHVDALRDGLRRIVERTRHERPDISHVQCDSWLNDVRGFLTLFPPQWAANRHPGAPGSHMGWWGQFMDRTGAVDQRKVQQFQQRAVFPFQHQSGGCTMDALEAHLRG